MTTEHAKTHSFTKAQLVAGAVGFSLLGMAAFTAIDYVVRDDPHGGLGAHSGLLISQAHATPEFKTSRTNNKIDCVGCHFANPTVAGYRFKADDLTSCGKGFYNNRNRL